MMKLLVACGLLLFAFQLHADELISRFGVLSTNLQQTLLLNGKPVNPKISGNNSLTFLAIFRNLGGNLGQDSDVVLIQNNGGTACPALYHVATITSSGIKVTPEFGTCSDLIDYAKNKDTLTFALPRMDRLGVLSYYTYNIKTKNIE